MIFAPAPSVEAARRLNRLVDALAAHLDTGPAALSQALISDSKFFAMAKRSAITGAPFVFAASRYDRVMGRLSAVWPADLAWPADVARPAPESADWDEYAEAEARGALGAMYARKASRAEKEEANGDRAQG